MGFLLLKAVDYPFYSLDVDVGDYPPSSLSHQPLTFLLIRIEKILGEDCRTPGLVDNREIRLIIRTDVSVTLDLSVTAAKSVWLEQLLRDLVEYLCILITLGNAHGSPNRPLTRVGPGLPVTKRIGMHGNEQTVLRPVLLAAVVSPSSPD